MCMLAGRTENNNTISKQQTTTSTTKSSFVQESFALGFSLSLSVDVYPNEEENKNKIE